jgi:hypothetical protein
MKRLLLIFTAVAALFAAGCETVSIDTTDNIASDEMVEICIVADAEDDDTRIALDGNTTRWEVGDCITLALTGAATNHYTLEIASADDITNNGKTARFTGSVAKGSYTQCTAIYPAIEDNTTSIISRHNEAVYMVAHHNEDIVIGSASASIPMSFRHLMHKLDYNLTLATGYTDTDISKGVAIEMVARSNGEDFSLEQCRGFNIYTAYSDTASSSTSHIADFTSHNFIDKPIASALIFPATIPSAELEFNVYVEGRKVHTIIKSLNKDLTMSAGKTSKISLTLSAENKSKEAAEDNSGNIVSDFVPDHYITTFKSGVSGVSTSYGIGYRAYLNNSYFDVHVPSKYATSNSISEGEYTWTGTSWFGYNEYMDFTTRNAGNLGLSSSASLASGSKMVVSKSGDDYIINITLIDNNGKTLKYQYIGKLNVDNGGQTGSSGGASSTKPDVTLSSLSLDSSANYPILKGSNSSGDAITLHINSIDGITSGAYEYIARDYCQHKGYFNASDITIGGTHKSAKSGILYIAKSSGSTTLHADITFNDGDTRHFKFDGKIEVPVVEGDLTLSASKSSIVGNGSDSVKFTVMQDGRDVTNECSIYINNAWHSSSFSSTTPGTYTVYATKGSKTSNTISITVTKYTPSSLTLSASKSTLKANGTDSVTFTVKADNNTTVTNLCEIYVNGVKQSGVTFSTYTAGNYSVYAKYNGVTSNTITLTATTVNSGKRVVFAEGVTLTSGWYDVNKKSTTNSAGADAMMCWAASSSNIAQWFQDRYVADGNTLPAGCPNGTSSKYDYELQIMDVFRDNWDNLARGNWTDGGVIWYFEGYDVYETNGQGSCAHPRLGTGGYFKSQWSGIFDDMYKYENGWAWYTHEPYTYATEINNSNWRGSSIADPLLKFSEYIVEVFEHGISSMAVAMSSNFGGAHAVTIWGYEIDNATGYVTKLYIADSDDGSTPVLQHYTVSPESGNSKIVLNGYNDYYPFALYPVSGYNSAVK